MRIVQVVPYIEDEASGPTYTTTRLNSSMNERGVSSQLVVTADIVEHRSNTGAVVRKFPRQKLPYKLGRSPEMYRWLREEASSGKMDIIHNHSIWMMPNVYPGWVSRETTVPLVVSPRGTFSKWAMERSRLIKVLFWNGLQKQAIAHAKLFHATAESEYEDIRRLGFRQPVAIIPNGIDIPKKSTDDRRSEEKTLLFLGRIHPVKGLELLLEAWTRLQSTHADWRLRVVGPGDPAYRRKLSALALSLGAERVTFTGPLYGLEKVEAYQSANLFVLPTHSENFGMAVAEALAAGCPVVTTKGAPWADLPEQRAGWWIDIGIEPLRLALDEAMSKHPRELMAMGARGRAWMERDFSWGEIAARMIESYRWVREKGAQPGWIRYD